VNNTLFLLGIFGFFSYSLKEVEEIARRSWSFRVADCIRLQIVEH
jgi:hypothetical protein